MGRLNNLNASEKNILKLSNNPPINYPSLPINWQVQGIQNATGVAVNLDKFSVNITCLPVVNGVRLTAPQFLNYIRLNINTFVNTNLSYFEPHPLIIGEATKWYSNNPISSIVRISIPGDNGSVIVSSSGPNHWIFSTITEPYNGSHPVSGSRRFGFEMTSNGGYLFYTQGADRIYSFGRQIAGQGASIATRMRNYPLQFSKADSLWTSFQNKVVAFVRNHQGCATKNAPVTNRPKWTDVISALENNQPLNTVNCD